MPSAKLSCTGLLLFASCKELHCIAGCLRYSLLSYRLDIPPYLRLDRKIYGLCNVVEVLLRQDYPGSVESKYLKALGFTAVCLQAQELLRVEYKTFVAACEKPCVLWHFITTKVCHLF